MPKYQVPLDRAFQALADPTRRAVLARLAEGPTSVTILSEPFGMALPSFVQHLKVLEAGGLIVTEKTGRTRVCRINPTVMGQVEGWIADRRRAWEAKADRLQAFLEQGRDLADGPHSRKERQMDDFDLVLTRRMAASPDRVYRCWTEPALLVQWFTPKPVVTKEVILDLRPGGRMLVLMVMPDGTEYPNEGCVLAVEPNRRLVFTECLIEGFRPAASPMLPMTAEMTFEPDGTGTLYTARAIHGSAEFRDKHVEMGFHDGWGTAATQLEALAKGL